MMDSRQLTVITPLSGRFCDEDTVNLTEKFVEGMNDFSSYWQGPIKALANNCTGISGNLDHRNYKLAELNFDVSLINFSDLASIKNELKGSSVVLGGSIHYLNGLAKHCLENQITYVHCSEYTLKTRLQIVNATAPNLFLRLRRYFWEWNQEKKNRYEISLAAAAQCNGVPVFELYKDLNKDVILYFDNRIAREDLAHASAFNQLPEKFDRQNPIQLAFSGRLDKIKGADAIIRVAHLLLKRNLPFKFHIYGGGKLEEDMRSSIISLNLQEQVTMHGVLDFSTELLPTLKEDIDLFVCCHIQGDPSCTYLETFACGIPIVGYLNEAFEGILNRVKVGWGVPLNDDVALADKIEEIIKNPSLLEQMRLNALRFASENTFHNVFSDRIQHMRQAKSTGSLPT